MGQSVSLDGSGSTDEETPAGDLLYSWDFGDATAPTDPSTANFEVAHTYTTAGVYTATLTVTDPQGLSDTDQVVVNVDDTAPVAAATADPTTVKVQHRVNFDASDSSDAETPDDELTFHWDFKDGETATGIAPTHSYRTAGIYPVELTVTDPQGATDVTTVAITVTNTAPAANGTVTPSTPHVGEAVTFDATTSTDSETPRALTYDWDFGGGAHASTPVANHTFATTGSKTVKLTVTDPQGLKNTKSFNFTVAPNGAPTAVATTSHAKANVGQNVTFDATGSTDPEGTDLGYTWDFGNGDTSSDAVTSHAFVAPGTYTITLTVTDGHGLTASDTVTVQVGNETPTAALTITPQPAYALQTLTFDGSGSTDPETPDQLTYSWLFGDGTSTPYSVNPQVAHAYDAPGTYTVTLRVKDAKGALGTQTHTLEVVPNAAPVAAASATPATVHLGGTVTFDGGGSTDPDGDELQYRWAFPHGPDLTGITVRRAFATAGTFDITLTVTDTHGVTDTTIVKVVVVNDAPTAAFTTSRGIHRTDRPISFSAEPSTDTEDPDELAYAWDFGDGTTDDQITTTHTFTSPGAYTVTLTVTDPQGLTDTTTRTVYVATAVACQDPTVTKSAHWRTVRSAAASGRSYCDNLDDGSAGRGRMTLRVTGDRVGLTFGRSTAGGAARVLVDGVVVGKISFRSTATSPTFRHRRVFTGLGEGPHVVKLKMIRRVGYVDTFLTYGVAE